MLAVDLGGRARQVDPDTLRGASGRAIALSGAVGTAAARLRRTMRNSLQPGRITLADLDFDPAVPTPPPQPWPRPRAPSPRSRAGSPTRTDAGERLVLLTRGAVATAEGEDPDLAGAALWGLMRSAQLRAPRPLRPDRQRRLRGLEAGARRRPRAGAEEPQIALREGELLVPRLAAAKRERGDTSRAPRPRAHRPDHRRHQRHRRPGRPPPGRAPRRPPPAPGQPPRAREPRAPRS